MKRQSRLSHAKREKSKRYVRKALPKAPRRVKKRKRPVRIIDLDNPLDRALALMKAGTPQKAAAKAEGVSEKAVRKFRRANTNSKRVRGNWVIKDRRAVKLFIFEAGQIRSIPVGKKAASEIGHYWNAVNRFLETNDASHLLPYRGASVRDALNKRHVFETDPRVLRRSDSIGDLSFHTLYRNTVV